MCLWRNVNSSRLSIKSSLERQCFDMVLLWTHSRSYTHMHLSWQRQPTGTQGMNISELGFIPVITLFRSGVAPTGHFWIRSLWPLKCKTLTLPVLKNAIYVGNRFPRVELKDAYFKYRSGIFLRFAFEKKTFKMWKEMNECLQYFGEADLSHGATYRSCVSAVLHPVGTCIRVAFWESYCWQISSELPYLSTEQPS